MYTVIIITPTIIERIKNYMMTEMLKLLNSHWANILFWGGVCLSIHFSTFFIQYILVLKNNILNAVFCCYLDLRKSLPFYHWLEYAMNVILLHNIGVIVLLVSKFFQLIYINKCNATKTLIFRKFIFQTQNRLIL